MSSSTINNGRLHQVHTPLSLMGITQEVRDNILEYFVGDFISVEASDYGPLKKIMYTNTKQSHGLFRMLVTVFMCVSMELRMQIMNIVKKLPLHIDWDTFMGNFFTARPVFLSDTGFLSLNHLSSVKTLRIKTLDDPHRLRNMVAQFTNLVHLEIETFLPLRLVNTWRQLGFNDLTGGVNRVVTFLASTNAIELATDTANASFDRLIRDSFPSSLFPKLSVAMLLRIGTFSLQCVRHNTDTVIESCYKMLATIDLERERVTCDLPTCKHYVFANKTDWKKHFALEHGSVLQELGVVLNKQPGSFSSSSRITGVLADITVTKGPAGGKTVRVDDGAEWRELVALESQGEITVWWEGVDGKMMPQ